jgi:hypothetical protein
LLHDQQHYKKQWSSCEISAFHGGKYEDDSFLECSDDGGSMHLLTSTKLCSTTSQKAVIFNEVPVYADVYIIKILQSLHV